MSCKVKYYLLFFKIVIGRYDVNYQYQWLIYKPNTIIHLKNY